MRKHPKQERSRKLVESLVDATALAITRKGLEDLSVNYVAELAGVSQGSLYQYFEDREDLLIALMERLADEVNVLFDAHMARDTPAGDSYAWLLGLVRIGATVLHRNEGLYMELVRNWHALPTQVMADRLQQRMMTVAQFYLMRFAPNQSIPDLPERLFICFNSVLFTMVRMYSLDQPLVREEVVIQGLARMAQLYLADRSSAPGPTGSTPRPSA